MEPLKKYIAMHALDVHKQWALYNDAGAKVTVITTPDPACIVWTGWRGGKLYCYHAIGRDAEGNYYKISWSAPNGFYPEDKVMSACRSRTPGYISLI